MAKLNDVFGVSKAPILSYIERKAIDDAFIDALATDKQIVVYGASKQGKTSLVNKHIPADNCITLSCSRSWDVHDIYKTLLRKMNVELVVLETEKNTSSTKVGLSTKLIAKIPGFFSSELEPSMNTSSTNEKETTYKKVEINLRSPQDVFDIYNELNEKKVVVLENFHYLSDEVQREFAFDLRSFQDLGLRFIVLGIWREKNRLYQFNGDLLDRMTEISVEPWTKKEFFEVAQLGAEKLNIRFEEGLLNQLCNEAMGSIAVAQGLLRNVCRLKGVLSTQENTLTVSDRKLLDDAKTQQSDEYASRYVRSLEDMAKGINDMRLTKENKPLFLPYYFVTTLLCEDCDLLEKGLQRKEIENNILKRHYRPDSVRSSDFTYLFNTLSGLQMKKNIVPPIFDYDHAQKKVHIIDSTFCFFVKNCDSQAILAGIEDPTRQ